VRSVASLALGHLASHRTAGAAAGRPAPR
jgi:hypothetical protein